MRTWIFQGNPEVFDIEGYLAASSGLVTWTVARYANQISPGDSVYIWQSKGNGSAQAGILAEGTILKLPDSKWTMLSLPAFGNEHRSRMRFR